MAAGIREAVQVKSVSLSRTSETRENGTNIIPRLCELSRFPSEEFWTVRWTIRIAGLSFYTNALNTATLLFSQLPLHYPSETNRGRLFLRR